jgi:hypothetical protein
MANESTGTSPDNLSTRNQEQGDAKRPADTLDRDERPRAEDFDPAGDVGKAEPSGNPME